jgi:hypothetical protein
MTADGNYGFMITTGFPVQQIFQMLLHQFGGRNSTPTAPKPPGTAKPACRP